MKEREVSFSVNGQAVTIRVEPRETLVDSLRLKLGLTGTHVGCEQGVCGACTVLVDGQPARACLLFSVQAAGHRVTTIEGISGTEDLTPIQRSMRQHHALQCGFCTPGMVVALHHLFEDNPTPTDAQIEEAISGQLCRCTGYSPIIDAARAVAEQNKSRP